MFEVGEKFRILDINKYDWTGFKNGDVFTVVTEAHYAGSVRINVNPSEPSPWVDLRNDSSEAIRFERFEGTSVPRIVKENPYRIIDSEQIAMFDCDDTLIMWDKEENNVEITCPYQGTVAQFAKHEDHIKLLKDHYKRGFTVIVWSGNGHQWAKAVVDALGLQEYVHFIMSKPSKFFDDLPAERVLVNRVYLEYKGK